MLSGVQPSSPTFGSGGGGGGGAALRAGAVGAPAGPQGAGVLLLHPHPALGGSMWFPPVEALFAEMDASAHLDLVVRYNMRGAGGSGGRASLWGGRDAADLREICALLLRHVSRLYLVGYSWGSCVAAQALSVPGVAGFVGVSFPAGWVPATFLGSRRHLRACLASPLPKLFLHGTRDHFTGTECMRGLLERYPAPAEDQGVHGGGAQELAFCYEEWPTDHFWARSEQAMACSVRRWVEALEAHRPEC